MAEGIEGLVPETDGVFDRGTSDRQVTHFSARARGGFSIQMEGGTREGKNGGPIRLALGPEVAEQVEHHGWAERGDQSEGKTADGAELLLELAGGAGLGGEVAGVVDAGGQFINEEMTVGQLKEFHGQQADEFKFFCNLPSQGQSIVGHGVGDAGGKHSAFENPVDMPIFERRKSHGPRGGIPGDEHRNLTNKGNMFLENGPGNVDLGPGGLRVGTRWKGQLSFAVVAESGGFEAGFARESWQGSGQFVRRGDDLKAWTGESGLMEKPAFPFSVLADMENGRVRKNRAKGGDLAEGFDGNIFEFIGDHIAGLGQAVQGGVVLERGGEFQVGDRRGGAGGVRVEYSDTIAHPPGRQGQHPTQLSSADDADGLAGGDHGIWRSSAMAKRAAAIAPLGPMGKVATGMPAGIWAMERSESMPRRVRPATGTPRTGRAERAAAIPGR